MLASFRRAVPRLSLRRTPHVRTLTDSAAPDASTAAESSAGDILSPLDLPTPSAIASSSSLARTPEPTSTASIHIPPAEDPLLHLFTSLVMNDGKRHEAARATSQMLLHLHAFTGQAPLPLLRDAVVAAAPLLRCLQFKRAAKQYVFPTPLSERQRARTAIEWMLEASKKKGGKQMPERFAREVVAVLTGKSKVLEQKASVHKLAVLHRGNVLRPPRVPKSKSV